MEHINRIFSLFKQKMSSSEIGGQSLCLRSFGVRISSPLSYVLDLSKEPGKLGSQNE